MTFSRLRWIVFSLAVGSFWLSFFHRIAPAAIASDLTTAFDVSGAALGALAAGWVVDASARSGQPANYTAALGVLALFTGIGLLGAFFIRETRCRNTWVM